MGGGGGGGGGGNESSEISQREKEIIASTFKQLNDGGSEPAAVRQAAETAKFLSEVQSALRDQSLALAGRLQLRELSSENSAFSQFQQEMGAAAAAMAPPATQLQQQKWQDAIVGEQKALQHLLRAEATFRQIEVAYGARGGGGGGAGRDLASLFDLELDTEKNQYETRQTASAADQRAQDVNDALKKLDELARRQEELAQRPPGSSAQEAEQRWQQEMLEREAQQLQQQLQQLAQSGQQAGQQSGQPSGQTSGQQSSGQSGGQGGTSQTAQQAQQRLQEAEEQLRQAQEDMRRAGANGRSAADQRLAAERLREAGGALGGLQSQQSAQRLASIANEAQRLSAAEAEQRERLQHLRQEGLGTKQSDRDQQQLINDRQRMADDLASLAQNMRNAARELDAGQHGAAEALRSALKDMDDSDLEPLVQRTTDWLRTGIDPNSRDTESDIAAGLARLKSQTHEAQQALNAGGARPGTEGTEGTEEALNRVARLRQQIDALSRAGAGQPGGNQPGANQPGGNQQGGSQAGGNQQGGSQAGGNQPGGNQQGDVAASGDTQPGGGANASGYVDNNIDTGGNARPGAHARTPAPSEVASLRDGEQQIQQGLRELQALRQQGITDPAAQRQIQQLISAMQHLDLRRFPGNPEMVEHIHQQLLSDVDTLELQLRQSMDAQQPGQIRSSDPLSVPRGYEDAVAEYYRRLSAVSAAGAHSD
jgi:hypothetical protein